MMLPNQITSQSFTQTGKNGYWLERFRRRGCFDGCPHAHLLVVI